jgi:ABC-2 type transport system permease protein
MIKHHFRYEWINLRREKLFIVLSVLFLGLTLFAVNNGKVKVLKRANGIAVSRAEVQVYDSRAATGIDSLNTGLKKKPESWLDPRMLSVYGQRGARVVAMDPAPLAVIATGQSDLYSNSVKPTLSSESHSLRFSELTNPVQLLFGSFDLAFVCVYLLPLLVLALSYNILSEDKEQGILRLTGSQPISIYSWLISKIAFRFFLLSVVVIVSIIAALLIGGVSINESVSDVLQVIAIVLSYILFWFAIAVIVNLNGKSSGMNAATLVGAWVIIVLILPAVISQTANSIYPVPSRVSMIHEFRVAQAESTKNTQKIMQEYMSGHPELAPKDTTQANHYSWWLGYFARADVVNAAVHPLVVECNVNIERQQAWVSNLRFTSPAILLQDAMNDIAGTSTAHYNDFRDQVMSFSQVWRSYFAPRMFGNQKMQTSDISSLPAYKYSDVNVPSTWTADLIGIVLFTITAFVVSLVYYRRVATERLMLN